MLTDEVVCIHTTHRTSHAGIIGLQTRCGRGWPARRAARMTAQGLMRLFIDRRGTPAYLAVSHDRDMPTLSAQTDDGLVTNELLRLPECPEALPQDRWPAYAAHSTPDASPYPHIA
jgi:hypothetical protein